MSASLRAIRFLVVKQSDYNGSTRKNNGSAPDRLASLSSAFAPAQKHRGKLGCAKSNLGANAKPLQLASVTLHFA